MTDPTDTAQGKGKRNIKVSRQDLEKLAYHADMARKFAFMAGFCLGILVWMTCEITKQWLSV